MLDDPVLDDTVRGLRDDFAAAISSAENDVTLDPSIAKLRDKISGTDFLQQFSIYSKGHLRKIDDCLQGISVKRLKNDPLQVALAVESILELFGQLGITVAQSVARHKRMEAKRSS
jgi:hypothetical protein